MNVLKCRKDNDVSEQNQTRMTEKELTEVYDLRGWSSDSTAAEKYFESIQGLWLELKLDIFWGTTRWEIVLIWYFAESLGKIEGATQLSPFSPHPQKKTWCFLSIW